MTNINTVWKKTLLVTAAPTSRIGQRGLCPRYGGLYQRQRIIRLSGRPLPSGRRTSWTHGSLVQMRGRGEWRRARVRCLEKSQSGSPFRQESSCALSSAPISIPSGKLEQINW